VLPRQTRPIAIDSMIPIGCGQCELIIRNQQIGKMANNYRHYFKLERLKFNVYLRGHWTKSIFGSASSCVFEEHGALKYTIVVVEIANFSPTLQYLTPHTCVALAKYFMYRKHNTFIIYDDL